MNKKAAIIITTFSQDALLEKCIKSIKNKTHYKNYRIFLVDDGSKNKSGERIRKKFPFVNVTANKTNTGFSKANNIGIKKALKEYNPDYILLLNDDTEVVQGNWLSEMIDAGEKNPSAGILGCRIVYPDGSLQWVAENGKIKFFMQKGFRKETKGMAEIQKIDNVIGACFLIKRKVIKKIGLLDEKFSPFYGEETDFCYRAKKAGFDIVYAGGAKIIHARNKSISSFSEDDVWYIKKRNSIRMEWMHFSPISIIKTSISHCASAFMEKRDRKITIEKNIPKKTLLLLKAYANNIRNLNEIIKKRNGL